jgi:hypothetical protein
MPIHKSPLAQFILIVFGVILLAAFGPEEKSLGSHVRIVYLHGAWVLAAEFTFLLSGLCGLIGLISNREGYHKWSAALGRAATVFWITYLPLSLWAMQSNWNGLFPAEPRFRLAFGFAIAGLLLQTGLWFFNHPRLTSAANLGFIASLGIAFSNAEYVMHPPPSPIFNSGLPLVVLIFMVIVVASCVAAFCLARWFFHLMNIE